MDNTLTYFSVDKNHGGESFAREYTICRSVHLAHRTID